MKDRELFQFLDPETIMDKCAKHFVLVYRELEDKEKLGKREDMIFDAILSRYTGETQSKTEYVIKSLPKIHEAIIEGIARVIAENNRELLRLLSESHPSEPEL
jgi:hypothetical protein